MKMLEVRRCYGLDATGVFVCGVYVLGFWFFDGGGWIRVFGRGFGWRDLRKHPLVYSERIPTAKVYRLGPWMLKRFGDRAVAP